MKKDAYRKIVTKREESLGKPIFLTSADDYVRAFVRVGEDLSEVKMRLKGDWIFQLQDSQKWSFRIEVKGDDSILAMKRFSIHHPRSRNYIGEWLLHRALKRSDVIALRYEFVDVTLNNRDLGIYAIEEHFEKRLVENNRRREGPIVRFNEDLWWKDALQFHNAPPESKGTGSRDFMAASVDAFKTTETLNDPVLGEQFITAANLLEATRLGQLTASEAFDVDRMATYVAMLDLFGGWHAITFLNVRFYYNPVTSLLEPIAFDANAGKRISWLIGEGRQINDREDAGYKTFRTVLFSDPVFYKAYVRELLRISDPTWLDIFFAEIGDELDQNLAILRSEFTGFPFSQAIYYQNAEYIRSMLIPSAPAVHAYVEDQEATAPGRLLVRAGNIQKLPVEVLGLGSKNKDHLYDLSDREVVLQPRLSNVHYIPIDIALTEDAAVTALEPQDLYMEYRILGTGSEGLRQIDLYPWPFLAEDFAADYLAKRTPNVADFDFLVTDEKEREIRIQPGEWTLYESLVIPSGYLVRCGEGTQIKLTNGSSVISYSPLQVIGSDDAPVVFSGEDDGGGVICLNAEGLTTLDHVFFEGLAAPIRAAGQLTGAVTFYESNVNISRSRFVGARCEDALNIVRSNFQLQQCLIADALSDGLDVDFGSGSIRNCSFIGTGNDAIDLANSKAIVEDCNVVRAGDKGLTVGEDSEATVHNLRVADSFIAIGSKDASKVTIDSLSVTRCDYGLTAYQKKPEFGPAELSVEALLIEDAMVDELLIEEGSTITVAGELHTGAVTDVVGILYPE